MSLGDYVFLIIRVRCLLLSFRILDCVERAWCSDHLGSVLGPGDRVRITRRVTEDPHGRTHSLRTADGLGWAEVPGSGPREGPNG